MQIAKKLLFYAVLFFSLAAGSVAHASDRDVQIHNATSSPIFYLYIASSGSRSWGGDVLANKTISSGYYRTYTIGDDSASCYYDFRAVLDNGRYAEKFNVNVCAVSEWWITNNAHYTK